MIINPVRSFSGFACQPRIPEEVNACFTNFASDTYLSVAIWTTVSGQAPNFISSTTFKPDGPAFAHGVIVRRSGDDPTWPAVTTGATASTKATSAGNIVTSTSRTSSDFRSSASSTSQPSVADGNDNGGLDSNSAKMGIAVGVSLGFLLLIGSVAAAFLLGRRRRRRQREGEKADRNAGSEAPGDLPYALEMDSSARYTELAGASDGNISPNPRELPADSRPTELDAVAGW
ncbi:hypothetical protein PG994_014543 [Apiospora phragmitis]|uniref:Uncharacterized protein n=1 Tax=Apiospora phragmitis TaxID=2905665 RepID=A0ABR1T4L6_9PEZI